MPIDQERYIAAVEVSSSKIVAAVGKISPDGQLEVIAVEQEKGVEAVRYGIIQNLEETSMKIARIINRLEQRPALAHRRITGLYVALSGRSLRSIATEVSMPLPDDTEINEDILRRLRDNALHTPIDSSLEVVDAVPRIYRLGKTDTHSPKGMIANSIRATFDLIVCRPELKRNLMRTISDKLGIKVSGFVVTALATGHLILSDEQKRLGCMLADMGAETTTVTIYKGGYLRYFAPLPLGGRNITRDITSLNLLEEKAEETKITSGQAIPNDSPSTLNINGIKISDVSNLIVARAEEIVANVLEQTEYAGLGETALPAGIICIGGGSRLNGMLDLLSEVGNLPVNRGQLPPYVKVDDAKVSHAEIIEVTSVLYAGATHSTDECLEEPKPHELPATGTAAAETEPREDEPREPKPKRPGKFNTFFRNVGDRMSRLFTTPDEDNSDLLE